MEPEADVETGEDLEENAPKVDWGFFAGTAGAGADTSVFSSDLVSSVSGGGFFISLVVDRKNRRDVQKEFPWLSWEKYWVPGYYSRSSPMFSS